MTQGKEGSPVSGESWVPSGLRGEAGASQGLLSPTGAGPPWASLHLLLCPLQLGSLEKPPECAYLPPLPAWDDSGGKWCTGNGT